MIPAQFARCLVSHNIFPLRTLFVRILLTATANGNQVSRLGVCNAVCSVHCEALRIVRSVQSLGAAGTSLARHVVESWF